MNKLKAIIIDDIEQARLTLRKDLETYTPELEIIGEATGVVDGARLLRQVKPDLVFLDIQMQDGSGFDLLDIVPDISFKIIFITASDAHAIKAFRYAAIDYLMKPVDPDELVQAVKRAGDSGSGQNDQYQLLNDALKTPNKQQKRLALHSQDKIHVIEIQDIIRCESQINYTEFYLQGDKKLLVTRTLKEFEDLLTDHGFFRVHQSHLVNTACIREFIKTDGGSLILKNGDYVPVSVRKRPQVLDMIERL